MYPISDCPLTPGRVAVDYKFVRPDKRIRDLGNLEKAISDLLVGMSVIDDDSMIQDMRLRWVAQGDPLDGPVVITVTPFVAEDES